MTLAQIVEKPITVAIDETISSFAESRQGRRPESLPNQPFLTKSLCRLNGIHALQAFGYAPDKLLRA
jgi:hypothetical protein